MTGEITQESPPQQKSRRPQQQTPCSQPTNGFVDATLRYTVNDEVKYEERRLISDNVEFSLTQSDGMFSMLDDVSFEVEMHEVLLAPDYETAKSKWNGGDDT